MRRLSLSSLTSQALRYSSPTTQPLRHASMASKSWPTSRRKSRIPRATHEFAAKAPASALPWQSWTRTRRSAPPWRSWRCHRKLGLWRNPRQFFQRQPSFFVTTWRHGGQLQYRAPVYWPAAPVGLKHLYFCLWSRPSAPVDLEIPQILPSVASLIEVRETLRGGGQRCLGKAEGGGAPPPHHLK